MVEPFPKRCHFPIEAPRWAPSRWQGTFHNLCIQKPDGPLASTTTLERSVMPREHLPWGWLKNDSSVSSCGRASPWVISECDWSLLMSCVAYNRVWQVIGCIWVSTPSSGSPWNSSSQAGWSGAQMPGSVLFQGPPLVGLEAAPLVVSFLPLSVKLSQRPYFSIYEL